MPSQFPFEFRPVLTRLCVCIVLTTILSLSIHVIMLDVLGIAHPDNSRVGTAAILLNEALSITATIVFYRLAKDTFDCLAPIARCLLLAFLYAMLGEALLRNFIMGVVVSHDWIYCFVESLPRPIQDIMICSLVVAVASKLARPWMMVACGLAIAAIDVFALGPAIDAVFARLIASVEFLDTGNIYNPPYGWQVTVPSYVTFLEPVIASYAIAALTLHRLSPHRGLRTAQFVLLIMAIKHSLVPIALYSFYQPRPLTAAILSESQFTLEVLTMALLTAIGWQWSTSKARHWDAAH